MTQKFILLFCLFVCHAKMQGADILSVPLHYYIWQSDENILIGLGTDNPAIRQFFPTQTYTQISTQASIRPPTQLHYTHQGDAGTDYDAQALGHTRGSKSTLFGAAAYLNGNAKNIRWTHVEDAQRIGPYQLADSTTGNKQYETYYLQGGIAWQMPVGVLGLSADYQAQSTYRTKNPRSYSIISDFHLTAGWALPVRTNYLTGLSFHYGNYSQNLNVANQPNDRKDLFYFMYGYGFYNQNISGSESNFTVRYKGNSYGTSLHLLPVYQEGWFLKAGHHHETMEALYAQRIQGSYKNNRQQSMFGHQWQKGNHQHRAGISIKRQSGTGAEYYYETVVVDTITASSESRLLSKSTKYIQSQTAFSLFMKSYLSSGRLKINPNMEAGLQSYTSEYKTTPYNEEVKNWFAMLGTELIKVNGTSLSGIGFSAACHHTAHHHLVVPTDNRIIQNTILPDHQFRAANKLTALIRAQHLRYFNKNMAWRFKAGYHLTKSRDHSASELKLSLALIMQ
jgi:hypothetical protein